MLTQKKILIMGAAGRDFHNFNVCFRDDPKSRVVAFTAFQIPNIAGRTYPRELAGELYPDGIPIYEEEELPSLIAKHGVEEVIFSYSDVSHNEVMHRASFVNSLGADFRLMGVESTQLKSSKPVVSVGAIRTGCGKSQTSRCLTTLLRQRDQSTVVVRHPMPYGDLRSQRCQRFATLADCDRHECTIEEREEYEGHIQLGHVVYAGVDYEAILRSAEQEAEIVLWDGGNNDVPFFRSDLHVVLVDPHRPGHEYLYHPGETNMHLADVIVIPKTGTATADGIEAVRKSANRLNPQARLIQADSVVTAQDSEAIAGKRVLIIEDGPTLTHGDMSWGAGWVAAKQFGASEIIDPRSYAVGSIREVFSNYPHVGPVLPAMGYDDKQTAELKETIEKVPCDLVLVGTPFNLARLIQTSKTLLRVSYEMDEAGTAALSEVVDEFLACH